KIEKKTNINKDNFKTSEILDHFNYQDKNSDLENNEDNILYELSELEKLVAIHFANVEEDESESLINEVNEYNDNIELDFHNCNKLLSSRKVELKEDKRMFEFLTNIIADNIQNNNFYIIYKKLKHVIIKEIKA
ncbi:3927_t:CDS:2, partial [Racocetra fulgida]